MLIYTLTISFLNSKPYGFSETVLPKDTSDELSLNPTGTFQSWLSRQVLADRGPLLSWDLDKEANDPLLVFLLTLAGLVYLLHRLLCLCSWLTGQGTSGGSESPSLLPMGPSPLDFSFHGFNEYPGPTTCRSAFPARPLLIPVLCIQYLPSIFNIPPACLQIYAHFPP